MTLFKQKLLTSAQASKMLAICPRTLWSLTKDGAIPHVRIGRCVRYNPKDLEGWINAQTTEHPATQADSGVSRVLDFTGGAGMVGKAEALAITALEREPTAVRPAPQQQAGEAESIAAVDSSMGKRIRELPAQVLEVAKLRGWKLDKMTRGCYLHLEASELIESLRGKRGSPIREAADVLIVLMSITEQNDIPFTDVAIVAEEIVASLRNKPPYAGEHAPNRRPEPSPTIKKRLTPLTERQKTIYNFIVERLVTGRSPTYKEISNHLGLPSPSSVYHDLNCLELAGIISRVPGQYRSIRLVNSE